MQKTPARPFFRRCLRLASWTFLILALVLGGGCLYAFRDRHPGYAVRLQVAPPPTLETNQASLRVGFSRVKINPDLTANKPVYLAGFRQNRKATSIHDDLWAMTCVLDDGRTRLGIVALDAIGFFHDEVIQVRTQTAQSLGLQYVVVCSTHNHNTPDLLGLWGPSYLKTGVNKVYRQQVIDAAVQSLGLAVEALQPARVAVHEIPTAPEGLVGDSRKPIVFDPDIRLMHFTNPTNDATLGSIVSWASHPETVWSKNTEITADYPGYLRDVLEKGVEQNGVLLEPGLGGTHVFINGAVGGLMSTGRGIKVHDPYLQQDFQEPTHDKARALGRNLASRILRRLDETNAPPPLDRLPIVLQAKTVEIPLDNTGYLLAPVLGLIDRGHVRWKHIRTEVALIRLGDTTIACIPGEIYPELVNGGIERAPGGDYDMDPVELPPIRELMPGRVRFIFGLANDEIGYIIPKSEWDRKKPYIYGAKSSVYGEINSCGPEVASVIHQAVRELSTAAGTTLFFDSFRRTMAEGWSWIREQRQGWRLTERGLEIRVEPGNMWGPANDAKNVLLRQAPDPAQGSVEITVQVENHPTEQYEQVDLVWHYDDSHMVKIGQEQVDGQLSIVMGREEKDTTRTLAIIPLPSQVVELRLRVEGTQIQGFFRPLGAGPWTKAGQCDLPAHTGAPHITLQCYQGPAQTEHWAVIQDLRIRQDPGVNQ